MDQRKLDSARRVLGVDTETEAIDQALDITKDGDFTRLSPFVRGFHYAAPWPKMGGPDSPRSAGT
jgi:hypothetical protein